MNIRKDLTADVVHGREINEDTHRAIQSSLLLTYNTSTHKGDLEAAAFALACFINCHPAFKGMSAAYNFNELNGPLTSYELMDVSSSLEDYGTYD